MAARGRKKAAAKSASRTTKTARKVDTTKALPPWSGLFLEKLEETGSVYHAAAKAGISRQAAYKERDRNPALAEAWDVAVDRANGGLEASLFERAKNGTDDMQLHEGLPCRDPETNALIVKRKHETALAIFMAKKRMPERYGDAAGDGDAGDPIELPDMTTLDAVRKAERVVLDAYNRGAISGARYDRLMRGVESRRRTIESEDLERRLASIEAKLGGEP